MNDNDYQEVHEIASSGDVEKLKALLDKHPELINAKGWLDNRPLHCAAQYGWVDCVRLLIERGADIHAKGMHERTPLFDAVDCSTDEDEDEEEGPVSDPLACTELILKQGADPNVRNTNRRETPLFFAQNLEMLLLLEKYGADLDVVSYEDQYPFETHALYMGEPALLKFWLGRGVEVNHVPGFGEPVLCAVVSNLGNEDEHDEEKVGQVRLLLDYGADPNIQENLYGNTPLHIAASRSRLDLARELLDGGADPNALNHENETPLHVAVQKEAVEIVKLLIERGADVNLRDVGKVSPWDLAKESAELRPILEPHAKELPIIPQTPDQLIERLSAIPSFNRLWFSPCSEDEIRKLEETLDVLLPESYKKFLRLMGKGANGFLETDHWDAFYPYLLEIGQREGYANYCDNLPEHYFVFASRLGGIYLFFIADGSGGDDPPVYSFGDGHNYTYKKIYDSFWNFFEEMVTYYEVHNKRGLV